MSVLVGLAFAAPALAAPGGIRESDLPDVLVKKDNSKLKCEIVSEGPKETRYKDTSGKEKTLSNDGIDHIEFKGWPEDLGGAERSLDKREYQKALDFADTAIGLCGDGRMKDLFLARARVAKARALRGLKRYKEAIPFADQAIEAANNNRWAGPAHIEKVYSLALAGDEGAKKAYDDANAKTGDFGDEFGYDVSYAVGLYYKKAKDASNAKSKISAAKSSNRPELVDRAELALAEIKILESNPKGARDAFEALARKTRDPETLAGCYVGLGNAQREEAAAAQKPDDKGTQLRMALELYLKGVILAVPSGTASTENHETAIRESAKTYEMILETIPATSKNPKDMSGRRFILDEARKQYEDLVRQYPGGEDDPKIHEKIVKYQNESKEILAALEKDRPSEGK